MWLVFGTGILQALGWWSQTYGVRLKEGQGLLSLEMSFSQG